MIAADGPGSTKISIACKRRQPDILLPKAWLWQADCFCPAKF
jgi:hypothetical protein